MLTEHVAQDGSSEIVKECSLPRTGERVVHRIITDPAVLDGTDECLRLVERRGGPETQVRAAPDPDLITDLA